MPGRLFGLSTLSGQNGAQYTVDFFLASVRQQNRGVVPAIDIQCTSALYGSCKLGPMVVGHLTKVTHSVWSRDSLNNDYICH
jgi:hypothetical protein